MIVYLTVRHHFNAGHRLHNPALGDEENRRLYGKCNLPAGHGHNYRIELTLRGDVVPSIGAFVNAEEVRRWLWSEVLEPIDHHNLNVDVPLMASLVPTAENLARAILDRVRAGPFGDFAYEVKVHESENNVAACRVNV